MHFPHSAPAEAEPRKQVTEERRFDLGHKMSTLMYSKTNGKRVLVSSMGHKKWTKYQQVKRRNDAGDRARSCVSHLEKRDEDGEERGDRQQEGLDDCFSLA